MAAFILPGLKAPAPQRGDRRRVEERIRLFDPDPVLDGAHTVDDGFQNNKPFDAPSAGEQRILGKTRERTVGG